MGVITQVDETVPVLVDMRESVIDDANQQKGKRKEVSMDDKIRICQGHAKKDQAHTSFNKPFRQAGPPASTNVESGKPCRVFCRDVAERRNPREHPLPIASWS